MLSLEPCKKNIWNRISKWGWERVWKELVSVQVWDRVWFRTYDRVSGEIWKRIFTQLEFRDNAWALDLVRLHILEEVEDAIT